jgi:hypothetical protein
LSWLLLWLEILWNSLLLELRLLIELMWLHDKSSGLV